MSTYPDASVLVAAFVVEVESERAETWLVESIADVAVSGWLELEFASALAAKQRAGAIDNQQRIQALSAYRGNVKPASRQLTITDRHFARAAEMIDQAPGLRGGDTLHLAIAEANGCVLVTLDRKQAELGARLGVETRLL